MSRRDQALKLVNDLKEHRLPGAVVEAYGLAIEALYPVVEDQSTVAAGLACLLLAEAYLTAAIKVGDLQPAEVRQMFDRRYFAELEELLPKRVDWERLLKK